MPENNRKVNILKKLYYQGDINFDEFASLLDILEVDARHYIGDQQADLFLDTTLKDAKLIKPRVFGDRRGYFLETYSEKKFTDAGINVKFLQDNHSMSADKGVLRGFHFQRPPHTQSKLVRVLRGAVYDVIIDLRKDSPTYKKWEGFRLSAENKLLLFIPQGFAHAFCTQEPDTEFFYKVDAFYAPESDDGFIWNDNDFKINWPVTDPILSDKDAKLKSFREMDNPF